MGGVFSKSEPLGHPRCGTIAAMIHRPLPAFLLLSLSLLSACTSTTTPTPPTGKTTSPPVASGDDVPTVARATRPAAPNCAVQSLASQVAGGDLAKLSYANLWPTLRTQASASTLAGLLLDTRTLINAKYYGFSAVDLQALHETWEANLRKTFGNLQQAVPSAADPLMAQYISAVNDDHTFYLSPASYQAFKNQGSGSPTPTPKFGFRFAAVPGEDGAVLIDIDAGTPAAAAGLQRGDTILSVNGVALTRSSSDDNAAASQYSSVLAAAITRGGSVTLGIRRGATPLSIAVTPSIVSSSSVPSGRMLGSTYLLRLPSFATAGTAQRVHDLVRAAQNAGAKSLILDLRGNRGGLVSEATGVSAAFAPKLAGQTLEFIDAQDLTFFYNARSGQVAGRGVCLKNTETLTTIQNPALWTGKLATLVNADSASASEVVTETLQKAGASAFGEVTVGVGNTATTISDLGSGNRGLSVTIARSRALDGQYLTAKVAPNVAVSDDLKALAHGDDLPLEAALNKVQ
ncbi:PDZ domain-containing protein [Deinococcus detaillensis]|uniref:PDZ domain-containing protein n=2 Tax=Deinococcus detaillensis TaxID=2592048 RepID=A0A553USG9_9DEIO|nr:PDZ domain-containing protein [Deinococcus detaillensis]